MFGFNVSVVLFPFTILFFFSLFPPTFFPLFLSFSLSPHSDVSCLVIWFIFTLCFVFPLFSTFFNILTLLWILIFYNKYVSFALWLIHSINIFFFITIEYCTWFSVLCCVPSSPFLPPPLFLFFFFYLAFSFFFSLTNSCIFKKEYVTPIATKDNKFAFVMRYETIITSDLYASQSYDRLQIFFFTHFLGWRQQEK